MPLLFATLVFLIVVLIFGVMYAFAREPQEAEIIRNRLEAIGRGAAFSQKPLDLGLIRDELLSSIPALNRVLARWSWPARLRKSVGQAGLQMRPGKLLLISAVLGLSAFEGILILYHIFALAAAAGSAAALLPLLVVGIKRRRRLAAFERRFPDAIDLLSRSVRAGHSFTAALEIASTDLPDPLATEFRITFDQQRFGLPSRDALLGLCERMPLVDVRLFVVALLVQKETGGNLTEILGNLSHVIRERFRIAGDVRVRTIQGRLTAGILIVLPFGMLVLLHYLDPEYVNVLFVDRLGKILLTSAALLQALGAMTIWKIVQIKV